MHLPGSKRDSCNIWQFMTVHYPFCLMGLVLSMGGRRATRGSSKGWFLKLPQKPAPPGSGSCWVPWEGMQQWEMGNLGRIKSDRANTGLGVCISGTELILACTYLVCLSVIRQFSLVLLVWAKIAGNKLRTSGIWWEWEGICQQVGAHTEPLAADKPS